MNLHPDLGHVANVDDLRTLAARKLPRMVFDYIDGASGDESTARRNRDAFGRYLLDPEILVDVSHCNLATALFGQNVAMPVIIGPTGLNGAFWPDGDRCLARAAHAHDIPFVMSTAATMSFDSLVPDMGPLRWFQLYMLRDRGLVQEFLARIHDKGFPVLELTVDTAVGGRRNRDIRNGFTLPFRWTPSKLVDAACHPLWALSMLRAGSPTLKVFEEIAGHPPVGKTISEVMQQQLSQSFTWDDLAWLRAHWPGKLVLKGVCAPTHIEHAIATGMDGVVISNHGGRQLDGAGATIECLPRLVDVAAGRLTMLIDSGFRSGTEVAKALALGADAVQLGRATLYGLAAAGEAGVRHTLGIIARELECAMALTGATTILALQGRVTATQPSPPPRPGPPNNCLPGTRAGTAS